MKKFLLSILLVIPTVPNEAVVNNIKIEEPNVEIVAEPVEVKDTVSTKSVKSTTKKSKKKKGFDAINYYTESLPTELETEDGFIMFCGTKYNPVPSQCCGDGSKTATGASTAKLIADPYHYGLAITKIGLKYFNMHDTVQIEYMDKYGNWNKLYSKKDSTVMTGIIEDRMNPRFNKCFCIDILCAKEQMRDMPFYGRIRLRIKKL